MRLIDADDIDILGYLEEFPECETDKGWNAAIREVCFYVNFAPIVDAVPVVRCRDCRYGRPMGDRVVACGRLDCAGVTVWIGCRDTDFCSYGERRE